MTDESAIPRRRKTDGQLAQWVAIGTSALLAIGGTSAFTFNVYESIRNQLVELGTLQPTLSAHISADSELQRLCQSRMDYLERKLDSVLSHAGAPPGDNESGVARNAAMDNLSMRLKRLEQQATQEGTPDASVTQ